MPVMMTGAILEEMIASITKMVEDIVKHMHRQEEALSYMAGKIHDHEQRTQAAEASLKILPPEVAFNTSNNARETPLTPPHQVPNMSRGQPVKVVKVPCVSGLFSTSAKSKDAATKEMGSIEQPLTSWNSKPQIDLPKVGNKNPRRKHGLEKIRGNKPNNHTQETRHIKPQIGLPEVGNKPPRRKDGLQEIGAISQTTVPKRPEVSNYKSIFHKLGASNKEKMMVFRRLGAASQATTPERPASTNPQQTPLHITIRRVHRPHVCKEGNKAAACKTCTLTMPQPLQQNDDNHQVENPIHQHWRLPY
ncbi:hypothetical protein LIER_29225 [Lithospermum erythrorhizon]|uniref:Uncharacterized protein n=1 Tax=Lithospermum erythrorhizon TaxID=34254 RepID=A0AAV3RK99_LITER